MFDATLLKNDGRDIKIMLAALYPDVIGQTTNIASIKGIEGGVQNFNYAVTLADGQKYFFSIIRPEKAMPVEEPRLDGVTRFMAHQAARGVICPAPQAGKDGTFYQSITRADGTKSHVILTSWVDGVDMPAVYDVSVSREMGRSLGRFAEAGRYFVSPQDMGSPLTIEGLKPLFLKQLGAVREQDADKAAIHTALELRLRQITRVEPANAIFAALATRLEAGLADEVMKRLQAAESHLPSWKQQLPRTVCHKDFHKGNAMQTPAGVAIIDPDWLGRDIAAYDLAMTVMFECVSKDGFNKERAKAIISGYDDMRPLTAAEKEALPELIRAAGLRFFMRRFANVMAADEQDIRRAPEEFIDRLHVFETVPLAEVQQVIAQATAPTLQKCKFHAIAGGLTEFLDSREKGLDLDGEAEKVLGLTYRAANSLREKVAGRGVDESARAVLQGHVSHSFAAGCVRDEAVAMIDACQRQITPATARSQRFISADRML